MKALILAAVLAVPPGYLSAPVYVYSSDGVMERQGTYVYKPPLGYVVLYCIAQPPRVAINCVVHTPADQLVLVDAQTTEHKT